MIDLTLVQLRMLREVARQGTMGAAASALGYTPSAVSQQLGQLERNVGVDLFERVGRNVHLTDAGYDLAARADHILGEVEAAGAALEASQTEVRGVVHLGLFESIAAAVLPRLLASLADEHPELEVRTRFADPGDAAADVANGELDLAFTIEYDRMSRERPKRLAADLIHVDAFRLVVPESDPITATRVPLADMADRPFIGSAPGSPCGRLMMSACAAAGFRPDVVHEFEEYGTVLRLVAAGQGVSLIPDLGLCDVPAGVRVVDLAEPVTREIVLTYRTVSADRPAITAVREHLARLVAEPRAA